MYKIQKPYYFSFNWLNYDSILLSLYYIYNFHIFDRLNVNIYGQWYFILIFNSSSFGKQTKVFPGS